MMTNKTVLITGICGFIGFHTALKFQRMGWKVIGIDNFNSDYYESILKSHRAEILGCLQIRMKAGDITKYGDLSDAFWLADYGKIDLVIHLAASAGVRFSMNRPDLYIKNNIIGTQTVIDICQAHGIKNVIYASTSCVMEGYPVPWKEESKLGPHLSPYGYTKATNESQFHISDIPNAVGLRFFTVYGPWGRPDMALFDFTKSILEDKEITIFNNGDMLRDFTYVDDIVDGIYIVSQNMSERDIYNIGRGNPVNLMDFVKVLAKKLVNKTPDQLKIRYAPKHPADAKQTWADTTKLQALGYNPQTDIDEGIDNFLLWYGEHYK